MPNSTEENSSELSHHAASRILGGIRELLRKYLGPESRYQYEAVSTEKAPNTARFLNGTIMRALCAALLIVIIGVLVLGSDTSPPPSYHGVDGIDIDVEWRRYNVGSSIGPKEQLRIQWHNASEWGRSNPHQNGEVS